MEMPFSALAREAAGAVPLFLVPEQRKVWEVVVLWDRNV